MTTSEEREREIRTAIVIFGAVGGTYVMIAQCKVGSWVEEEKGKRKNGRDT